MFGRKRQVTYRRDRCPQIQDSEFHSQDDVINRILDSSLPCPQEPVICGPGGDYGDSEWDAGFKVQPEYFDCERDLEKKATETVEAAVQTSPTRVLPDQCCDQPLLCNLDTKWQGAFKGCPTTYIEGPLQCNVSKRDPRAWVRYLDEAIQERAIQTF